MPTSSGDRPAPRWRPVDLLDPEQTRSVTAQPFSYAEVGATRTAPPRGWDRLEQRRIIGAGADAFDRAARALLGWQVQLGAGLRVRASAPRLHPGPVALLRLGRGLVALTAPVRVVWVIELPRRVGFGYGTLPGHPETGEESFVVDLDAGGEVSATISAFSRPASRLARIVPAATRLAQRGMASVYLSVLARWAAAPGSGVSPWSSRRRSPRG